MCASYGLTSESRRRRARERQEDPNTLFAVLDDEPETFDDKVDLRILPASLEEWLSANEPESPL